jgi:hypothetical protein
LLSPDNRKKEGKHFCRCPFWQAKSLKKINRIFGRIKEVLIFALPIKKGVKKVLKKPCGSSTKSVRLKGLYKNIAIGFNRYNRLNPWSEVL